MQDESRERRVRGEALFGGKADVSLWLSLRRMGIDSRTKEDSTAHSYSFRKE